MMWTGWLNDTLGAVTMNVTDSSPSLPQLWKKSIARSRSTPRLCRTAMTAPHSTCQEEGSLGSAVAAATCPRRRCRFCGAGCTSTASTPTRQSRRNSVCQARPTSLCCRWGAGFYLFIYFSVLARGNDTCGTPCFCILVDFCFLFWSGNSPSLAHLFHLSSLSVSSCLWWIICINPHHYRFHGILMLCLFPFLHFYMVSYQFLALHNSDTNFSQPAFQRWNSEQVKAKQ